MLCMGSLACILFTIICLYKIMALIVLRKKAISSVTATIVYYRTRSNANRAGLIYYPVFYYNIEGKEYIDQYDMGFPYPYWMINSQVILKYTPNNPLLYYIEDYNYLRTYMLLSCGFFLGFVFSLLSLYCCNIYIL